MKKKYFGTDGIRGTVNKGNINGDMFFKFGLAVGTFFTNQKKNKQTAIIAKDTRLSGYTLEPALVSGLTSAGMHVYTFGPLPTNGLAMLTKLMRANMGIMITASHNPYYDNGLKLFGPDGLKLSDRIEKKIESLIDKKIDSQLSKPKSIGRVKRLEDGNDTYLKILRKNFPRDFSLKGMKIVIDCANGAGYKSAPKIIKELGAQVITVGTKPNGLNINKDCGSTQPKLLQATVRGVGADLGIALDGDGDRLLMVDSDGNLLDGDHLLYLLASHRQAKGTLKGPVVGTLMSNLGLEVSLKEKGIEFFRANVGDRYVLEMLHEKGGEIGGETSGHMLVLDKTTTGDGLVSALQVLDVVAESGKSLQQLVAGMPQYPQTLINVRTETKVDLEIPIIQAGVKALEAQLGERGRVVLRASGTEPVVRVMVEGQDHDEVVALAEQLAEVVRAAASA